MKRTIVDYKDLIIELAPTHTRKQIRDHLSEICGVDYSQTHLNRFINRNKINPVPEPIKPPTPKKKERWLKCVESMLGQMSCDSYDILTGEWV